MFSIDIVTGMQVYGKVSRGQRMFHDIKGFTMIPSFVHLLSVYGYHGKVDLYIPLYSSDCINSYKIGK